MSTQAHNAVHLTMSTPLNVSTSDLKPQSSSNDMEFKVSGGGLFEIGGMQIRIREAAAGVSRMQPNISLGASPAPSGASEEDERMLGAIAGALQRGPRAVVDAMLKIKTSYEYGDEIERCIHDQPLSAACAMDLGVSVISALLEAFPDDARKKDDDDWTALHWAARWSPNLAVVVKLLNAYPDAAFHKCIRGGLPLHHASFHNPNVEIIAELLKANPEGDFPSIQGKGSAFSSFLRQSSESTKSLQNFKSLQKLLAVHPDIAFITKGSLFACLPVFTHMDDLPSIVMRFSKHPLHTCIELSATLMQFARKQRSKDVRLANDADEKAADLEQLACAIARKCNETKKFGQEMDDCLALAADLKLKFFVSEPVCSRRIELLWWTDVDAATSDLSQIVNVCLNYLFWASLNAIVNFNTKPLNKSEDPDFVSSFDPPPLSRFVMNRLSYLAFLVCLLLLPLQVTPGNPVHHIRLEIFLAYWLFDICFAEVVEFCDIMKKHRLSFLKAIAKYSDDPWNIYDIISLSAAVVAAVVRFFVYAGVGDATAASSNQLYAWALALLWGRLVNVLSVVSFVGPLLIMVLVMVFRDLSKFAFLVVLMELPFVAALYFLESGDGGNEAFATFPDSALSFFKIVIGQGPDISSVTASSSVLLSFGSVLLSVLLLNLLIAMFSKTFDTIVENSTQEYLLQKAQMTFVWMRAPRMPPPFASPVALRDWSMAVAAKYVCPAGKFSRFCAGWVANVDSDDAEPFVTCCEPESCNRWKACFNHYDHNVAVEPVEPPPPTFDKLHFFRIVFPKEIDREIQRVPAKREEWNAQYMQECEAKYEAWCKQVLEDLEENAEFNSEAQMDKFKSRMLRDMKTTVESSDQIKSQMVTQQQIQTFSKNAEATQEQLKMLSDAVLSQQAQIQQMHANMQLILKKLNA